MQALVQQIAPQASRFTRLDEIANQLYPLIGEENGSTLRSKVNQSKRRFADICNDVRSSMDEILELKEDLVNFDQSCAALHSWLDESEKLMQASRLDFSQVIDTTAKMAELMVNTYRYILPTVYPISSVIIQV